MGPIKSLRRKIRLTSSRDLWLGISGIFAAIYVAGFTIYIPLTKYTQLPSPQKITWLIIYAVSLVVIAADKFLPKREREKWQQTEKTRTEATNVAVSVLAVCVRESRCTGEDFQDVTRRLLTAMKQEVEQFVADTEGIYINVSLIVEDESRPDFLRVLNRANADRPLHVYPKGDLYVWQAIRDKQVRYEPCFSASKKEYHSILALPILLEDERGDQTSVGAVSIDSGRYNEFDDLVDRIRLRLLPYLSLLKLALSIRQRYGGAHARIDG